MKEIFNSICNTRVSIFRAVCALQRFLLSESSSISKTRRKDGWGKLYRLWKYYKICLLKMWCICLQWKLKMFCSSIWKLSWLEGMYKNCCVLNAIRRNTLQIINKKVHQTRKKTKKWREHQMMLNLLFTASRFHEHRKIWSPKFGQNLNI